MSSALAGYTEYAGKLVTALRDAIEADLSDLEERQVHPPASQQDQMRPSLSIEKSGVYQAAF